MKHVKKMETNNTNTLLKWLPELEGMLKHFYVRRVVVVVEKPKEGIMKFVYRRKSNKKKAWRKASGNYKR